MFFRELGDEEFGQSTESPLHKRLKKLIVTELAQPFDRLIVTYEHMSVLNGQQKVDVTVHVGSDDQRMTIGSPSNPAIFPDVAPSHQKSLQD